MTTLVIATRNAHKVAEIRAILGESFRYLTLQDMAGAPEVVENAGSFAGNATKKAVELAKWFSRSGEQAVPEVLSQGQCFVLADDSGLEVDALGGAPGVHSARFAALDTGQAGNSSATENNAKLLRLLAEVPPERRRARFRCAVALTPVPEPMARNTSPVCYADEAEMGTRVFEGACEGTLTTELRGRGGFGYDPLFVPEGFDRTFGELDEQVKNRLSHRARALQAVRAALKA